MIRAVLLCASFALAGCVTEPEEAQPPAAADIPSPAASAAAQIASPFRGQWRVVSVGDVQYPAPASGLFPNVQFDETGFFSHWAGCGGAFPAFYAVDGARFTVTRREAVRIGKCGAPGDAARERALATALDGAARWEMAGETLVIKARDGTRIVLARPTEPIPQIAGRWVVVTVGGSPLGSTRPALVSLTRGFLSAAADCNALSTEYAADAKGAFRITGSLTSTEMLCAKPAMAIDGRLFGAVGGANGWIIGKDGLLRLGGPQPIVLRRPKPGETTDRLPAG